MKFIFSFVMGSFLLAIPLYSWDKEEKVCTCHEEEHTCPNPRHSAFEIKTTKGPDDWNYKLEYWYSCNWGNFHCQKMIELEERVEELELEKERTRKLEERIEKLEAENERMRRHEPWYD